MNAPLDDITVIEIDNWMAAPSAGAVLTIWVQAIKVEPLTGDPMSYEQTYKRREFSDEIKNYDFQFDVDNRGKNSIAIAIDTEEGATLVRQLVSNAQVFMCNLLIARQEKYGLDPGSLFKENSSLVHATLTGYGTSGPDAMRPGYDVTTGDLVYTGKQREAKTALFLWHAQLRRPHHGTRLSHRF